MTDNNGESIRRTLKEKIFIEAYIENCGNATEAYLKVSPKVTRDSAKELGKRMLAKLDLSIVEILDQTGLTDPLLSKKLLEGLSAKRKVGAGENKEEVTDHYAVTRYLDLALKLKAKFPADRAKFELTGPDGLPLARTVILREMIGCPLKSQCPIKEKVRQAENPRKEGCRNGEKQSEEK